MHLYYITGTSSGLGKALAGQCLEEGNVVFGLGRTSVITHPNYSHIHVDLSRQENLDGFNFPAMADAKEYERIVLINNAAQIQPVKYIGHADDHDIIQSYMLNLVAPVVLTNSFLRTFEAVNAEKLVINISSGAANNALDGWGTYCSAKAGLDMFTRVAAMEREISKNGFVVVSVAPGVVDTGMQAAIRNTNRDDFSEVDRFKGYKANNILVRPETAASRILESVRNLKGIKHEVYSVKI